MIDCASKRLVVEDIMTNEGQTPGWGDLDDGWAAAALVLAHADDVVIRYRTDGTVMAASPPAVPGVRRPRRHR